MRTRVPFVSLLCVLIPLIAFASDERVVDRGERAERGGAKHFVLEPEHVLSEAEQADLARSGCLIQRALAGGRYLVRVAPYAELDRDLRVKRLLPLTADAKMDVSAWRAAAEGKPFTRVKILFHDDASFAAAQLAVEEAGGTITDPLARDFGPIRSLRAVVPSMSVVNLANDESVLSVYADRRFRATNLNADEAAMSNVTPLYSAPYDLSGAGVVLSTFELAPAASTHPEFEGRLTVEFNCAASDTQCSNTDNKTHATHTSGTMIAAGIDPRAKGMAPKATLHEYEAADPKDTWIDLKDTALKSIGSTADNNSWGYVLGWSQGTSVGWTWNGADELIGGYDGTLSAVLDHIAIAGGTLMVHSAGNEASVYAGPSAPPFKHTHSDEQGNESKEIYCYSTNGSGTDCPAPDCTAGTSFCEATRHPTHSPYGSIGWMAAAKNVVAVGAIDFSKTIASFSSRGPARDGRVKPDLVAKGRSVLSTAPPANYATSNGTSMAGPIVTGSAALFTQQWRKTFAGANPKPAVLKALAIAGADDLGNTGPDYDYGFGLLNAKASVDLIIADGGSGKRIKIDNAAQGSQFDYAVTLAQSQDLRFVLSWFDPEALPLGVEQLAAKALVNDLDLKVTDPSGNTVLPYVLDLNNPTAPATRGVNSVDNTEEVEIKGAVAGMYHVIVTGRTITANPPQPFVVISNADFGSAPPPCTDPTEPNDTTLTAYGPVATNSTTQARICAAADSDYFRFTVGATGSATVTVTATDTPLRVRLGFKNGDVAFDPVTGITVAAGTTQTLLSGVTGGTTYFIEVVPTGTVGASGAYTVSTTYPFTWPARRRASRR